MVKREMRSEGRQPKDLLLKGKHWVFRRIKGVKYHLTSVILCLSTHSCAEKKRWRVTQ